EGGGALLLRLARFLQCRGEFRLRARDYTLEPARVGYLGVAQVRIELGADEVVVVPQDRIALFRAPLVVAEDDHGDARPFLAADRTHLAHRDAEGAVARKSYAGCVGVADLGADDRREAIAART